MPRWFFLISQAAVITAAAVPAANSTTLPEKWKNLPQVWDHIMARSDSGNGLNISSTQNWAIDQIMDGQGTINLCMRWGSERALPQKEREHLEAVYEASFQQWLDWLPGWDNFPFGKINVNVVAWATNDSALIQGSADTFEIHTGFLDENGLPACNPGCSRELHQDGDYSACPGGEDHRFHQFLALDPRWGNYNMGAASSSGVYLSLYGWETIGSQGLSWPMPVHELGHSFGFPDFLTDFTRPADRTVCNMLWLPENAPEKLVMMPGHGGFDMAPELTEMEGWALRHLWSRFSRVRGWQHDNTTWPEAPRCGEMEVRDVSLTADGGNLCQLHL